MVAAIGHAVRCLIRVVGHGRADGRLIADGLHAGIAGVLQGCVAGRHFQTVGGQVGSVMGRIGRLHERVQHHFWRVCLYFGFDLITWLRQ